ncbi:hypothetical protein P3T76_007584 [Phytophthora citrophthora]|uniref:Retrotransposon gag domain-containing protein n=1 Tax=Phytophthora citrophthora TaxID=4793 RepID=A0AAD9GMJ6_9STRA|nr:hypothetical protein P3T76_007584 [Phytophthora citrophthora]
MDHELRDEIAALNGTVVNLEQGMTNLTQGLTQVQQMAQEAQRLARAKQQNLRDAQTQRQPVLPAATAQMGAIPAMDDHRVAAGDPAGGIFEGQRGLNLRKMDVKPPIFLGEIDGVKLNSFIFQFESYFRQKGYDLLQHDDLLTFELNQCVQKNALVWYQRYMTDDSSSKLWSAMKLNMAMEFMEPNFMEKSRKRLLTIKQTGGYTGYVGKFRELNRIVQVDSLTAMNVFLNGLSDVNMKREILRKKPVDLNSAIQEGFLEWELKEKTAGNKPTENKFKGKNGGNNSMPNRQSNTTAPAARKSGFGGRGGFNSAKTVKNCSHCGRGPHRVEDCWFKHPEKRPTTSNLNKEIFAMLERLVVAENQSQSEEEQLNE